jgi:phosphoglycerol transferase MdoB-like AlkP superfamily enzyme
VTQCGFPLLVTDVHWNVRQHLEYDAFASLHCLPDFLGAAGYRLFAYCAGACDVMRMKAFMKERGFRTQDSADHHRTNDDELFDLLFRDVLPGLAALPHPFALLILNADTHPDFTIGPACDDYLLRAEYPIVYRSFTCFDQHLARFIARMAELGIDRNTEVIVYGDHLTMGDVGFMLGADRNLSIFLPLRPQDGKWRRAQEGKEMSYYDFAPTVLELLEIDYAPPFPFGADLLGTRQGKVASLEDLRLIYGIAIGDIRNKTVTCHGDAGFCQSNEY